MDGQLSQCAAGVRRGRHVCVIPWLRRVELRDPHQRDIGSRLLVPPLHVRVQVRTARDVHPVRAGVGLHGQRFAEGLGLEVAERRESQHQCRRPPVATVPFCRMAFPSPPPHGGGTRVGSGQGMSGKVLGPNRGSSPLAFRFSAFSTFSGVTGISSTRTPTASYTALATAGMTGKSGPWPTSFAPKGPLGSGSSIRKVTTSHISRVVGLLYSSRLGNLWTVWRL